MQTCEAVAAVHPQSPGGGLTLHRLTDSVYCAKLNDAVRDLASDDAQRYRYPGPNPVSLDTGHFARLAGEPYYVCEKTDGVRYLMVCCTLEAPAHLRARRPTINMCALVDRALNAYILPVQHLPRAVYQGSLFDGELAFNQRAGRWEYLMFDALCVSGIPVLNGTLKDRLDAVHRVLKVYAAANAASPPRQDPCELRVKSFVPCTKMAEFEAMLPRLSEAYAIDGVILTPALQPIVYGRHLGMFKLKFNARHTVDFLVGRDGRALTVFESGNHAQVGTLAADQPSAPPGSIVECGLAGQGWYLVSERTDKSTANDMYTYQKTLLNMREKLTLDSVKHVFVK